MCWKIIIKKRSLPLGWQPLKNSVAWSKINTNLFIIIITVIKSILSSNVDIKSRRIRFTINSCCLPEVLSRLYQLFFLDKPVCWRSNLELHIAFVCWTISNVFFNVCTHEGGPFTVYSMLHTVNQWTFYIVNGYLMLVSVSVQQTSPHP